MNKVFLAGRLGKDPEMKYSSTGTAVVNFSVALNEYRKKGEGSEEHTTWVYVTLFGKSAENANTILKKGDSVALEGKLDNSSWTDKDGKKQSRMNVIVNQWELMSRGNGSRESASAAEQPSGDYF